MTPDELLRPRYKVIADYPPDPCPFKVGHIIIFDAEAVWHLDETGKQIWMDPSYYNSSYWISQNIKPDKHPHLFKKLEWWEDRKKEELPEYVKDEKGKIIKVKNFSQDFILRLSQYKILGKLYPSTEEEYLNQPK